MKYNAWTTNLTRPVYKTSYKANFITHWCKTIKLCKQPNWCFLTINRCWKTVCFISDKNIKKWQKFIAPFFKSKFYIFMPTVEEFKEISSILFISKHTKSIINIMFIYENLSFVKFLQSFLFVIACKQIGKGRT